MEPETPTTEGQESRIPATFVRSEWLPLVLSVLLPFLVFIPSLRYGFVYDDRPLILENRAIQGEGSIARFFARDFESVALGGDRVTSNYYRPVFLLVQTGLWKLVGPSPAGWHLAVVLLHSLVGGLAFVLLRRRTRDRWLALFAALLFSLHPVHVNSVGWVSGLQDVLGGFLGLAVYLCWKECEAHPHPARLAALFALGATAFLSKESTFGLLLLVAFETVFRRAEGGSAEARLGIARWAPLGALSLAAAGVMTLRISALGGFVRRHPSAPDDLVLMASLPRVFLEYLRLSLAPMGTGFFSNVRPVSTPLAPAAIVSLIVLLGIAGLVFFGIRKRPEFADPAAWFLFWLAPHLALTSIHPEWIVFDRYLYVAILALPMALVLPIPGALFRRRTAAVAMLALAAGVATILQLPRFATEEAFWRDAVTKSPTSSTAWSETGRLRLESGDLDGARNAYERASSLDPRALQPRLRLGNLAMKEGRYAEAAEAFRRIVDANPAYVPAWRNLVAALWAMERKEGAIDVARSAVAQFPRDGEVAATLVIVLRNAGHRSEALDAARAGRARCLSGGSTLAELERRLLAEMNVGDEP